ncbi:MAG: hypothetical protein LBU28_08530 [Spirochaetaceae bacterium]|nr:hypothetical protein [Spirochaetaceae bacterium]
MRTVTVLMVLFGVPFFRVHAQESVNREELETNLAPVTFINYEGPHDRIDTLAQIREIGVSLGTAIRNGAAQAGSPGRYFVIHAVSDPEGAKIDADIFGLGIDVGVDHIRNLRVVIQGYLEAAYEYSAADAALLAEYVTVYNAVFRGNWDYFRNRYKTAVIGYVSSDKAGISIRFDEWPGQTLMLIPLGAASPGSLSALDTSALTAPEVTEELRKDDDMGIDQRKEMVDLKEREAAEAEQRASLQREAIAQEEAGIARGREEVQEERQQVREERAALEAERDQVRQAQAAGELNPAEAARAEEALAAREEAADQQEAALDRREEDLARQDEALDERREAARQDESLAEQKIDEAQRERSEIARDQQELIDRPPPPAPAIPGVVMVRLSPDSPLGSLIRVDPATGQVIRASALNTVNSRTFTTVGGKMLAVAGENRGNAAIRLIEINPQTLEMAKQGDDDIAPTSLLWSRGNDLYAITSAAGSLYLARFDAGLVRQAQSALTVHPYGSPAFNGDTVLIQRTDGSIAILDAGDLTER